MTLLMADDDKDDREMLGIAFKEECPNDMLEFACDGEDLLNCLKRHLAEGSKLPDMILLDLNMPKMDGRQALKEIRENPRFKGIPVVIYTTSDSEDDREYTLGLGAKEYITKPFEFTDMLKICKHICGKSEA